MDTTCDTSKLRRNGRVSIKDVFTVLIPVVAIAVSWGAQRVEINNLKRLVTEMRGDMKTLTEKFNTLATTTDVMRNNQAIISAEVNRLREWQRTNSRP